MNYPEIFERCMNVVWDAYHEGGGNLSNDKSDKGGLTRWGIAHASHPDVDIINLTQDQAKEIFFNEYWTPMNLIILNDENLILNIYDHGITSGPRTSIMLFQKLVGVTKDGYIGPETVNGLGNYTGDIVADFMKRRKLFYVTVVQHDESQRPNLVGWLKRVDHTIF
jgi:lysozyme family protein